MNAGIFLFALLCLIFGIIIIGAIRKWRFFYDRESDTWYILKLAPILYLMTKIYHDLDNKYIVAFHVYIATGFILLSIVIFASLIIHT
jgi:ABC-type Na+ efflux pump permease subunit